MNCPECDKEIPLFDQEYDFCEECGVYLHYCGDFGWKEVPVLDPITSTLTSWNGTGRNFLDEIRNSPTSNFLLTRKKIAWLITNSENYSRSATKDQWMSYNFKRYGLDFRPIDDYGKYSDERKGDYVGFICKVNSSQKIIFPSLEINKYKDSKVIPEYDDNQVVEQQILEIIQQMMPGKNLRDKQIEGIESILSNPVTTVILPTGYGKTKIAQSAIISRLIDQEKKSIGPTLIIYPTISLIHDQRNAWEKELRKNIESYNKSNSKKPLRIPKTLFLTSEYRDKYNINSYNIYSKLIANEYDVLCCSPEFIFNKGKGTNLLDIIPQMKTPFSNIIIDEVHTFFDWGDSIRGDYLLLPVLENLLREINPNLHTIFMTATLHPRDEKRLINLFNLDTLFSSSQSIRYDNIREDLAFSIIEIPNKEELIPESCKIIQDQSNRIKWNNAISTSIPPTLIYSPNVENGVKEIYKNLPGGGEMYYGNLSKNKKPKISQKFMQNELSYLVCTSAFGMGVNKADVHLTSHIGMPYTLQEIYQMFGRTARGSRWTQGKPFKNGNCLAFVSKKIQKSKYKRNAIPPKLFERLYWSILNGKSTSGFFLFSLPDHRSTNSYWEPNSKEIWLKSKSGSDKQSIFENESTKWNDAKKYRRDRNEDFTIRSLLSLENSGYIRIRGIHPFVPVFSSEGGNTSIIELLDDGGYGNVTDIIGSVGTNGLSLNNEDPRYIVAEIIRPIRSINEFINAFTEADLNRESFHKIAQDELYNFFKSDQCVRKRFAPIIGKKSNEIISCIGSYVENSSNPLEKSQAPIAPCYVCRGRKDEIATRYISKKLQFSSSDPCLWLDDKSIESLSGRENQIKNTEEDIFGNIKNIPIQGFLIEFLLNNRSVNDPAKMNKIFIDKIKKAFPDLISKNSNNNTYNFTYKTKIKGIEEEGICEFSTMYGDIMCGSYIANKAVKFINHDGKNHFKSSYGILCYKKNNNFYVREFKLSEAKSAYKTLRKKKGGPIGNYDSEYDFLFSKMPDIGEGSINWNDLFIT